MIVQQTVIERKPRGPIMTLRVGIKTFKEVAARIGVSQQTMSAWFRGAAFTSQNLEALCRELQCSPNDVLTLDPNQVAPVAELALA